MTRVQLAIEISGLEMAIEFAREEEDETAVRRLTAERNKLRTEFDRAHSVCTCCKRERVWNPNALAGIRCATCCAGCSGLVGYGATCSAKRRPKGGEDTATSLGMRTRL